MNLHKCYSLFLLLISLSPIAKTSIAAIGLQEASNTLKKAALSAGVGAIALLANKDKSDINDPKERIKALQKEMLVYVDKIYLDHSTELYQVKAEYAHAMELQKKRLEEREKYLRDNAYRWFEIRTLHGHSDIVSCLQWSASKPLLVSGGKDGTVRVWHTTNWNCRNSFDGKSGAIFSASLNGDATRVVVGGQSAGTVLDTANGAVIKQLGTHGCNKCTEAWSPDSKLIASRICSNEVKILDATNDEYKEVSKFQLQEWSNSILSNIAFTKDSKFIVSGSLQHNIEIRNINTNTTQTLTDPHTQEVTSVAISPDSKLLASACRDGGIVLWDTQTWGVIRQLKGHTDSVTCVDWNHESRLVVSGSKDRNIKIWAALKGTCLYTFQGHSAPITRVVWGPKSCRLASASEDKTIKIWSKFYEVIKAKEHTNNDDEQKNDE